MIAPMPAAAADWIYREVLTGAYRRSVGAEGKGDEELQRGPAAVRDCRCQWGPCGWCQTGRPDRCAHRRGTARASQYDGYVLGPDGGVRIGWRRTGAVCTWHCPGPTGGDLLFAVTAEAVQPPPMRAERPATRAKPVDQIGLFDLAGAP